jgi:hypothetical protein
MYTVYFFTQGRGRVEPEKKGRGARVYRAGKKIST